MPSRGAGSRGAGSGFSRTGVLESACTRRSLQVRPFADQGRQAEGDRGGDLDRLQDHAVGEGVRGADAEAGVQDADHGELEDADVRGRRRHDRGHVDGEEDGGGGADAGLVVARGRRAAPSRRRAGSPRRRAGRRWRRGRGAGCGRRQPRPHLQQRAVQSGAEPGEAAVAVAPHQRRAEQHDDEQRPAARS